MRKRRAEESDSNFIGFQQESKLHQYGYNVIDGKLSSDERLDLLISLIESKRMSYIEICSTIENNIQIFSSSYRHQLAVRKWKDDLKAIGDYIIKNKTPVD